MFHVDDAKSINKETKVLDNFEKWIGFMHGYPNIGNVKSVQGKFHECFFTTLDYTIKVEVNVDI